MRGGQLSIGTGQNTDFTPVELLLAAIGGCTAADVDALTSRRAEPESFEVLIDAEKVRDAGGNHLTDLRVTFRIRFGEGEQGDKARALLPDAVQKSHDRLCTVSPAPWKSARRSRAASSPSLAVRLGPGQAGGAS